MYSISKKAFSFFIVSLCAFFVLFSFWTVEALPADDFVTTWKTDNPGTSNSTSITIPTAFGATYNYNVDWNNDGTFDEFGLTGDVTHDFGVAGTYTIRIQGTFPQISFSGVGDRLKILSVDQWGTGVWASMEASFSGCENLQVLASDDPNLSSVTNMSNMFGNAISFNQDISSWDVSNVTNMVGFLYNATSFNQPLSSWDVSSVTNMTTLFLGATSFNQPLNSWDVSSVTNMSYIFGNATSFNQDISAWVVSGVTNMSSMFDGATSFSQPLNSWNVSSVTNMSNMFLGATSFNQPLNSWNVSSVTNMSQMFLGATSFNQNISSWDVSGVTTMGYMFDGATSFNQNISSWDVSGATNLSGMFRGATSFNQPLNSWNVSSVTNMYEMFGSATSFNQPLNSWNVSSVTNMNFMFFGVTLSTSNYDGILNGWNALVLQPGVTFDGGNSEYCLGVGARSNMIAVDGWTISDGGQDCNASLVHSGDFDEALANNGSVTGSRTATLSNDTFVNAGGTLTLNTHYSLTNAPIGLVPTMSIDGGGTVATLTFAASAVSHTSLDSVTNLTITFLNGAFTNTAIASGVSGYSENTGAVNFDDPASGGGLSYTPPPVCSFSGPTSVLAGDSFSLSWGATWPFSQSSFFYILDGEVFLPSITSTTISGITEETTYTLSAVNLFGATTCTHTVSITPPPVIPEEEVIPPAPLACSLTAYPSVIQEGNESGLVWSIQGGVSPYLVYLATGGFPISSPYIVSPQINSIMSIIVRDSEDSETSCSAGIAVTLAPTVPEEEVIPPPVPPTNPPTTNPVPPNTVSPTLPISGDDDSLIIVTDEDDFEFVPLVPTQPLPPPAPTSLTFPTVDIADFLSLAEVRAGILGALFVGLLSAFAGAFASPLSGTEFFLLPARLWNIFLASIGIRKKNRPWGTVYDAKTKQPLDPVYVTLTHLETGKQQSVITDMDGRYSFVIDEPGSYTLSAKKDQYSFPSQALFGQKDDHLYQNLYFGEPFTVSAKGEVVTKNIPLDPTSINWNEQDKMSNNRLKFYKRRDYIITKASNILFYAGFLLATLALIFFPEPYNIATFALYILFALLKKTGYGGRPNGEVVDRDNTPIPHAIVRLVSPSLGQEMKHAVADKYGRYHLLANNGDYILRSEERKLDQVTRQTEERIVVKGGVVKQKIRL